MKIQIKEIFKELYKEVALKCRKNDFWNTELDVTNPTDHEIIELTLIKIQKCFQTNSIDLYIVFEKAFLQDIVQLKKDNQDSNHFLNYLQLSTFTNSAGYFNIKGLFAYTYASIVLSIRDTQIANGDELVIESKRLWGFLVSTNLHILKNSESLIVEWLLQLYYCSYSSGCFVHFCHDFWKRAVDFAMDSKRFTKEKMKLLSSLIAWNINYKKDTKFSCSDFLIKEYKKLDWDNDLKVNISSQIILLKEIDNSIRTKYFEELIIKRKLVGHAELQLLVSITENLDDFNKNYSSILSAINKYNLFLKSKITNEVLFISERARIFKTLNNLVVLLGNAGKSVELTKILGNYYDIKCELNDSILFVIPYFEDGILYFNNDKPILIKQDTFELAKDLIYLSNKLFNRAIALTGDSSDLYIPIKEMGIPSSEYSKEFEQKAFELYSFEIIKKEFNENIKGILQLGFNTIPVQALMLKQISFSYPIINSFSESYTEKKLDTILIWTSGSYTSYFEQSALIHLCKKYNVKYELTNGGKTNKNVFLKKYLNDEYSILWIASHGEYNNYEPHKSVINISDNDTVSIEELIKNNLNSNLNRLLVLNLCESGINSEIGGFKGFGFGHQLVSCNQSVISHLWMVNPTIAMAFGVCLAIGLIVQKKNYFDAYCFAVKTIMAGKEHVISELKKELDDLEDVIDRVRNASSIDWSNILNWGSPVMYK